MLVKEKQTMQMQPYTLRPVRMEDMDAVLKLLSAFSQRFMGVEEVDRLELTSFWTSPGLKLEEDLRLALNAAGEVVGYAEFPLTDEPPVHPFSWLRVHPDYLDKGVAEPLLDWLDERGRLAVERTPADLRVSVQTFTPANTEALGGLLQSRDYKVIRHSFIMHVKLEGNLAPPVWPAGIELRPFVEERHLEAAYRAYDESFSDHFGHVARPLEVGLKRFRHMFIEDELYDPQLMFLAWEGAELAGISLCYPVSSEDPDMGWLALLGVRRAWRKRGLGKALLLHTFAHFARMGKKKVGLGVDASNLTGALRLYENAGMYVARQYDRYEKELRPGKELMTTDLDQ
ncbi:MAG: GNAT family N-acetyltransferase [Anaerolineales bacterium]